MRIEPLLFAENCSRLAQDIIASPQKYKKLIIAPEIVDEGIFIYADELKNLRPGYLNEYVAYTIRLRDYNFKLRIANIEFNYDKDFPEGPELDKEYREWRQRKFPYVPKYTADTKPKEKYEYTKVFKKAMQNEIPEYSYTKNYSQFEGINFSKNMFPNCDVLINIEREFYGGGFSGYIGLSEPEFLVRWSDFFGRGASRFLFTDISEFNTQTQKAVEFIKNFVPYFEEIVKLSIVTRK